MKRAVLAEAHEWIGYCYLVKYDTLAATTNLYQSLSQTHAAAALRCWLARPAPQPLPFHNHHYRP